MILLVRSLEYKTKLAKASGGASSSEVNGKDFALIKLFNNSVVQKNKQFWALFTFPFTTTIFSWLNICLEQINIYAGQIFISCDFTFGNYWIFMNSMALRFI